MPRYDADAPHFSLVSYGAQGIMLDNVDGLSLRDAITELDWAITYGAKEAIFRLTRDNRVQLRPRERLMWSDESRLLRVYEETGRLELE